MTFEERILALYLQHGPMHLVPFIGDAYLHPKPGDFRVVVIGINAYLSDKDIPAVQKNGGTWFRDWWKEGSFKFYTTAYRESDWVARGLQTSPYFRGLHYVTDPAVKPCLYATNAIKSFLPERHKDAATITQELLQPSTQTWQAELDVMAEHGVFPHLIVVFGEVIWESIWKSFALEYAPDYQLFQILEYCPCANEKSPVFHRANRIRIALPKSEQTVLLVRLDHPATKRAQRKDAQWLLTHYDFKMLIGLENRLC